MGQYYTLLKTLRHRYASKVRAIDRLLEEETFLPPITIYLEDFEKALPEHLAKLLRLKEEANAFVFISDRHLDDGTFAEIAAVVERFGGSSVRGDAESAFWIPRKIMGE